jgi:conjugative transfer signal peptidase TraF
VKSWSRSRVTLSLLAIAGFASLAWASFVRSMPRVIYNASDSVPVGWYRIEPARVLHVGDIVLVRLPAGPAALAARRRYLPSDVPLLKRLAARTPQKVCIHDGIVRIDGVPIATTLPVDGVGRRLVAWRSCRRLQHGELFLLSTDNPASFDSRYFGPVPVSAVVGQARPLRIGSTR